MSASGTIFKINNDLEYGFIKIESMDNVFFSIKSELSSVAFQDLKVGDKVRISIEKTSRGLFAKTLSLDGSKDNQLPERAPEITL